MFDFVCAEGHEQIDVIAKSGDRPPCPTCGGAVEILWQSSFPTIIGDAIDYVDHNIASEPIHFTSKSERRVMMKQLGLREKIRHVGVPGSDRSPHTSRWF